MRFLLVFLLFSGFLLKNTLFSLDHVDTKSTQVPTVAFFNIWTVGWNADRLWHGLAGYWNAPIFHPFDNAFALSEPMPATMVVAPIVWSSGSPLLGYRAWLLMSLVGNGLAGVLLARRLGYGRLAQWCTGFAMILLPTAQFRIDVIQLVPIWGIVWFFSCLHMMVQEATWKRGAECGCAFAVCFWMCLHHSLFLSLLMVAGCLPFVFLLRYRAFFASAFVAVLVAVPLIAPVVIPVSQATDRIEFKRSDEIVARLAARPHYYLASQDNCVIDPLNWFGWPQPETPRSRRFHSGWIKLALAVLGICAVLFTRRRFRWTLFILLIGASAFFLSLGPHWWIAGHQPYRFISQSVPGFEQVRNTFRFAFFVQIAIVCLAMEGLDLLVRWAQSRRGAWAKKGMVGIAFVIAVGAAVEVWPEPAQANYVPQPSKHTEWVQYVREHCPSGQPLMCLPMSFGNRLKDLEIESRWMLLGLNHGVPMLNGYSGFFPASYSQLQKVVNESGASDRLFAELTARNVGLIVVARGFPITKSVREYRSPRFELVHEFSDEVGVDIYSLRSK